MPHQPQTLRRMLATLLTTVIGVLTLQAPAAAQVSIVPDQITHGGTSTFAFRLANQRPDANTTRLELTFPRNPPVTFVKVDAAREWTATVQPRRLPAPVKVGDRLVSRAADTLVLDGGAVRPGQFEQFLVTMGPLPGNTRLAFEATQTFADGSVARWNDSSEQGAPAITVGSPAGPPERPKQPAGSAGREARVGDTGSTSGGQAASAPADSAGAPSAALLWAVCGLAAVIVAAVGYRAWRRREPAQDQDLDLFDEPAQERNNEVSNR